MVIGYKLFSRSTPLMLQAEESRLASALGYDVSFEKREFLRPGAQRLLNVRLFIKNTPEEIAFCPELYFISENDPRFIQKIARTLDAYHNRSLISESSDIQKSDDKMPVRDNSYDANIDAVDIVSVSKSNLEDVLFQTKDELFESKITQNFENYELIVVPSIQCRKDQMLDIKANFFNMFRQAVNKQISSLAIVYGIAIGEIIIQEKTDFQSLTQQVQSTPMRKTNNELASFFSDKTPDSQFSNQPNMSFEEIENCVRKFESDTPIVQNLKALYVANTDKKRIDVVFELKKISEGIPYFASFESFIKESTTRISFDSSEVPTPNSFVGLFNSGFLQLGMGSWFTGKVELQSFSSENGFALAHKTKPNVTKELNSETLQINSGVNSAFPYWTINVNSFHLCNCNLEAICKQIDFPQVTGMLTDLTIDKGNVRQGIFRGVGKLSIRGGTIPVNAITILQERHVLEIVPQNIMKFRFANEALPYTEFALSFKIDDTGICLDSNYKNKIIACYENQNLKFGLFLSEKVSNKVIPYSQALQALVESTRKDRNWTTLAKKALNHLPISQGNQGTFQSREPSPLSATEVDSNPLH